MIGKTNFEEKREVEMPTSGFNSKTQRTKWKGIASAKARPGGVAGHFWLLR